MLRWLLHLLLLLLLLLLPATAEVAVVKLPQDNEEYLISDSVRRSVSRSGHQSSLAIPSFASSLGHIWFHALFVY